MKRLFPHTRPIFLVCFFILTCSVVNAQLVTSGGYTADEMAQTLVGDGVIVAGAVFDCTSTQGGKFECIDCSLGIDSGIILTSGLIANAEGPNDNSGITGTPGGGGDADLTALSGVTTFDACVLEFDVTVEFDTLKFQYSFGSDEYTTYVNTSFNDVFGFFISGPGIVGENNLAIIPGTPTPISINTVNPLENEEYYIDNGVGCTPGWGGCMEDPLVAPYTTDDYYINYDGFTVLLNAIQVVTPCETYHLKLAIADGSDNILDSGVFIKSRSLTSYGITLASSTSVGAGFDNAIEECVDAYIKFLAADTLTADYTVHFEIGGTATNGVDYIYVPDSIVLNAGEIEDSIFIIPFADFITEGFESVTIYLVNSCDGEPYDSVTIEIQDKVELDLNIEPDTTICIYDTLTLTVSGGLEYFWSPGFNISTTYGDTVLVYPTSSMEYTVVTYLGTCVGNDTVMVNVSPPPDAYLGPDVTICLGDDHQFSVPPGNEYLWDPPTYLDDITISDPIATPTDTGVVEYNLAVTDIYGCTNYDTVILYTQADPPALAWPDTLVCPGSPVQLYASGGVSYTWFPIEGLSDPAINNPIAITEISQLYNVWVIDANGCDDTVSVLVDIEPFPDIDAGPLTVIYQGETATLLGASSVADYEWAPPDYLSDIYAMQPTSTPEHSIWYYLTAVSPIGCVSIDSVHVVVIEPEAVIIPSAFTPNGDGVNDILHIVAFENVELTEFSIFNRWGEKIFETSDILAGWDGTFKSSAQEIGTYMYIFVGKNEMQEEIVYKGTINLLR